MVMTVVKTIAIDNEWPYIFLFFKQEKPKQKKIYISINIIFKL